jgi:hypothetical protein
LSSPPLKNKYLAVILFKKFKNKDENITICLMKEPGLCILAASAGMRAEIEVFAFLCKSQLTSHAAALNLCEIGVERYPVVKNRTF